MTDKITSVHHKVEISDLDFSLLPLCNYHIVIVVEPDPETWMTPDDDFEKFSQLLVTYSELILDELVREFDPASLRVPIAKDVKETMLIMVGESRVPLYFHRVAEYCDAIFSFEDVDFEKLEIFLRGVVQKHPAWRVAVIGAMYEDEIARVANIVQTTGLDTTILTRYSISSKTFINLDDLLSEISAERKRILGVFWDEYSGDESEWDDDYYPNMFRDQSS